MHIKDIIGKTISVTDIDAAIEETKRFIDYSENNIMNFTSDDSKTTITAKEYYDYQLKQLLKLKQ